MTRSTSAVAAHASGVSGTACSPQSAGGGGGGGGGGVRGWSQSMIRCENEFGGPASDTPLISMNPPGELHG